MDYIFFVIEIEKKEESNNRWIRMYVQKKKVDKNVVFNFKFSDLVN